MQQGMSAFEIGLRPEDRLCKKSAASKDDLIFQCLWPSRYQRCKYDHDSQDTGL